MTDCIAGCAGCGGAPVWPQKSRDGSGAGPACGAGGVGALGRRARREVTRLGRRRAADDASNFSASSSRRSSSMASSVASASSGVSAGAGAAARGLFHVESMFPRGFLRFTRRWRRLAGRAEGLFGDGGCSCLPVVPFVVVLALVALFLVVFVVSDGGGLGQLPDLLREGLQEVEGPAGVGESELPPEARTSAMRSSVPSARLTIFSASSATIWLSSVRESMRSST